MPLLLYVRLANGLNLRFGNQLPATESVGDMTIVAQIDESLQAVQQAIIVVVKFAVINHKCVKLVAGFKTADFAKELPC